jgi:hypothetical protein
MLLDDTIRLTFPLVTMVIFIVVREMHYRAKLEALTENLVKIHGMLEDLQKRLEHENVRVEETLTKPDPKLAWTDEQPIDHEEVLEEVRTGVYR